MPDDGSDGGQDRRTNDSTGGQPGGNQPQGGGQQPRGQQGQQPRDQPRGQQGQQPRGQPRQQQGQPGRPGAGRAARQGGSGLDLGSLPWVSGAVQGGAYFVVALISVAIVVVLDVLLIASGSSPGGGPGGPSGGGEMLLYLLGWVFYGAHFVSVSVPLMGSGNIIDLLGMAGLPSLVYYAIPPIYLFLAGRSVARSNGHASMENGRLATIGATVVAGYLPLAVVGAYAFTWQGVGPDVATTILIMGVVYPVVFGGLGGYLSDR